MQGNTGLSGARLHKELRDARPPAPVDPVALTVAAGNSTDNVVVTGMNITRSTNVLLVADAAAVDETAVATGTVVLTPSSQAGEGTVDAEFDFTNMPGGTPNLFRIYLTAPFGQRVFAGSVSTA